MILVSNCECVTCFGLSLLGKSHKCRQDNSVIVQSVPLNVVNVELGCEEIFSFMRSLTYYIQLLLLCVNFDACILHVKVPL